MIKLNNIKSVYIHIPFCDNICSYCDFCKMYYNKNLVSKYLDALKKEIYSSYNNEIIETIYIGGGTPSSLDLLELKKLLDITKIFRTNNLEFTIECNIENITEEKIKLFKSYGVNRISVGIQTFNDKYIKFLNRNHTKGDVFEKISMIKKYIKNINVDLMYALPNQTLEDLKKDLEDFLKLDVTHVSTYSLIIEKHTKLYNDNISNIDSFLDYQMYETIKETLKEYKHYEISNFSKVGFLSRHNLTYWNNDNYYGFGLGASGYIKNIRYTNTKNINKYINGEYIYEQEELSYNKTIENAFILGFRKINGISIQKFMDKYNLDLKNIPIINELIKNKDLVKKDDYIKINPSKIYIENEILLKFLDIDYEKFRNCKKYLEVI